MNKVEVNKIKDYVMISMRFCEDVFAGGFETYDQFQAFNQMCANHVDMCNTWLKRVKPRLGVIQYKRWKLYKDLRSCCGFTVDCMNGWLEQWQTGYEKAVEESKFKQQLEERCRLEHEIAIEYQKVVYENHRSEDRKPYCGFKIGTQTKKRTRKTNKKNVVYE